MRQRGWVGKEWDASGLRVELKRGIPLQVRLTGPPIEFEGPIGATSYEVKINHSRLYSSRTKYQELGPLE